uniref:Putative transcriptional regulator n=1 Tax=uncultured bacterium EC5 TaxID=672206 RepID=D3W8J9_9BACT|nr:putative transcriptional regulator [uncultured bacterium EC5]
MKIQSRFLLDLHRGSSEVDPERFLDWALERLANDLPFDSAMWASAAIAPRGPIGYFAHLHRAPDEMLVDYVPIKHLDALICASLADAGKTVCGPIDGARADFQPFVSTYGLAQGMSTLLLDAGLNVVTSISLYRADGTRPFTEAEARFKETVFPHLIEADTRNKIAHLVNEASFDDPCLWQVPEVEGRGPQGDAEASFNEQVRRESPLWRGRYLPNPLRDLLARGRSGDP